MAIEPLTDLPIDPAAGQARLALLQRQILRLEALLAGLIAEADGHLPLRQQHQLAEQFSRLSVRLARLITYQQQVACLLWEQSENERFNQLTRENAAMRAHLYELEEDLLRARIDERRLRLLKTSNRLLPPPPDLPPTP